MPGHGKQVSDIMRLIHLKAPKASPVWTVLPRLIDRDVDTLKPKELNEVTLAFAERKKSIPSSLLKQIQSEFPSFSHNDFSRVLLAIAESPTKDTDARDKCMHTITRTLPQKWPHLSVDQIAVVLKALALLEFNDDEILRRALIIIRSRRPITSSSIHATYRLAQMKVFDDDLLKAIVDVEDNTSWEDLAYIAKIFALAQRTPPKELENHINDRLQKEVINLQIYELLLDAYVQLHWNCDYLIPQALHLEPLIMGSLRILSLRLEGVQEIFLKKCCSDLTLRARSLKQLSMEMNRFFYTEPWDITTQSPPKYFLESLSDFRSTLVSRKNALTQNDKIDMRKLLIPLRPWMKMPF